MNGVCPACGTRGRLRRDGTVGVHYLWDGEGRPLGRCEGVGQAPRPARVELIEFAYAGATVRVSREDAIALRDDVAATGNAYIVRYADGTASRIPPDQVGGLRALTNGDGG